VTRPDTTAVGRIGTRRRVGRALLPVVAVTSTLTACGSDGPEPDAARFCAEVAANRETIVDPTLATELDVAAVVDLHRRLADLAPLAVAEEWRTLLAVVEQADALARGDVDAVPPVVEAAYAAERAAVRVAEWVLASCGVDLGPVTTISPQDRPEPADPPGTGE
jgi:hypothetical protein